MARFLAMALAVGYIGGILRQPGDKFEVEDRAFSANWMERVGGAAGAPSTAPAPTVPPVVDTPVLVPIPADWRAMHYTKRIALAKAISGLDVTADKAVAIIEAEADARDALARVGKVPPAPVAPVAVEKTEAEIVAEAEALAAAAERADAAADAAIRAAEGGDDEDI